MTESRGFIVPSAGIPFLSSRRSWARERLGSGGIYQCVFLAAVALCVTEAFAADALILARDVLIRQSAEASSKIIQRAHPGEAYEIIGRKTGKGQILYSVDDRGDLWVRIQVNAETTGFVRTDVVSVAREEFRSPRGNPLLIVNLRPTADGSIERDLWIVQEGWRNTRRLAEIEGRPIWASHGEWFICQVDSGRPVKDRVVDRTIEVIDRFSADGRSLTFLAAGSYPILNELRGEVYFYRDVDELGEPVPSGLFAVNVDGTNLHPLYILPERYRFWKEDGDFFAQVPPPVFHGAANRISLFAFDAQGSKFRFTVTLDGHLVEFRRERD
jgi:hypothetical protein